MTPLQKKYIANSLDILDEILASPAEIVTAENNYTQGKTDDPRFLLNANIPDLSDWLPKDIVQFNAVIFETNFRISTKLFNNDNQSTYTDPKEINEAKELLQTQYTPLLTKDTHPDDRLGSVRLNIKKIKQDLAANEYNSYSFFPIAIVGGAVAVAATAIILSRQ